MNNQKKTNNFKETFDNMDAWGIHTCLDIHDCDPALIRDGEAIKRYVIELCDLIEMKRFGEPKIVHFGEDERVAGYSLVQLIETSLISGHFANESNRVYMDIFSCKYYEPDDVIRFTMDFFKGKHCNPHILFRK